MTPLNPQADGNALRARLDAVETRLKCFADAQPLTDNCIQLLKQGRASVTAGRFDDARGFIVQAESLLDRAEQSEKTFRKWGWWIALYETVLLLVFLVLVVVDGKWADWLLEWVRGSEKVYLAPYCLWGGLGGVAAGLFGLYRHRAARDFDRGFIAYYFLKPILGLLLGAVVYLVARAGLMAVQGAQAGQQPIIQRPEIIYLGAFILGFSERFTLLLIDRVAGVILGPGTTTATPQPTAPVSGPPGPPAPLGGGSIRVEVVGPEELGDVSATLRRNGQIVQEKTAPDEDGLYTFASLALGKYEVEVKKPGWQAEVATAEVTAAGESLNLQVTLKPAAESEQGDGEED